MTRYYETMYILRPDMGEDSVDAAILKWQDFLKENSAENIQTQHRGKRRLAYEIQRCREGIYVQMNYEHDNGAHIAPMERAMRISDEVIRYLTVKLDPRRVKAEAEAEAAEA
jgi:small subunit ribosomal protein S6